MPSDLNAVKRRPQRHAVGVEGVGAGGCGKTLQKFFEFFQSQPRVAKDGLQGAFCNFFMVGEGQPAVGRVGFSQDNVVPV